jgi:drug/metabolite transporter (DMT)-like permease
VLAGLGFAALTAVSMTAGNLLEKHAVDRMDPLSARRAGRMLASLCTSPVWMTGFVVSLAGLGLQILSFALAPLAVVQSVYGAGMVLLVLAARGLLGERLGRQEAVGLGVVVVAVVLVGSSLGASSTVGISGSAPRVVLVAVVSAAAGAIALAAARRLPRADPGIAFGVGSGLFYGVASLGTKGASTIVVRHGVLGSVAPLLASPYPYLFVAASLLGLLAFQTGLQRAWVGVVAPLSGVVSSTYVVAVGMALFSEPLPSDPARTALRLAGFAGVLAGTALLAGLGPSGAVGPGPVVTAPVPAASGSRSAPRSGEE